MKTAGQSGAAGPGEAAQGPGLTGAMRPRQGSRSFLQRNMG